MPDSIRVYLNDRGYSLPPGSLVRDAIATAAPDLLPACDAGDAVITDGRGIALSLEAALGSGDIIRAARSGRRGTAAPPDGHAGG
jgi:hypothetical protein